jgi:hypothetical protein
MLACMAAAHNACSSRHTAASVSADPTQCALHAATTHGAIAALLLLQRVPSIPCSQLYARNLLCCSSQAPGDLLICCRITSCRITAHNQNTPHQYLCH